MSNARIGFLCIAFSVCCYSFLPVWLAKLLDTGMTALPIALWRFLIASVILWGLSFTVFRAADGTRLPRLRLIGMGTLLAAAALCAFYGLPLIPAGTFIVIFYTYPAMTAIIGVFLGDRLARWGWVALALTLVGIALTAPDFSAGLRGDNATGVFLSLLNALIVAVYFVINARLLRGQTAFAQAGALTTSGAFLVLLVINLFTGLTAPPSLEAWFWMFCLAIVSTILPTIGINIGIQRLGAARAAIVGSFEPVTTTLIAWLLLGQAMQPIQAVGGAVIIASVILLQTLGAKGTNTPIEVPPDAAVYAES